MKEFRPISLCNILYKLISKVLANYLKLVLPRLIDEAQSAFVPRKIVNDSATMGLEGFHILRVSSTKKQHFMGLRLDMQKTYDRVE